MIKFIFWIIGLISFVLLMLIFISIYFEQKNESTLHPKLNHQHYTRGF